RGGSARARRDQRGPDAGTPGRGPRVKGATTASAGSVPGGRVAAAKRQLAAMRAPEILRTGTPLLVTIVGLGVVGHFGSSKFLTSNNLQNLLEQMAVLGVLSVGQTFLMTAGLLDLSVGS